MFVAVVGTGFLVLLLPPIGRYTVSPQLIGQLQDGREINQWVKKLFIKRVHMFGGGILGGGGEIQVEACLA